jgi:hypothetical protein
LTRIARALKSLFGGRRRAPRGGGRQGLSVAVRCGKCGECIPVRIDRDHELQAEYAAEAAEGAPATAFVLRKEVVGANCQNLVRFTIRFDAKLRALERSIEGGEFVEPEQQ